jgi:hypothetical protein
MPDDSWPQHLCGKGHGIIFYTQDKCPLCEALFQIGYLDALVEGLETDNSALKEDLEFLEGEIV